jgi:hypothetical protein
MEGFDELSCKFELADWMEKFKIKHLSFCKVREDYFITTYDNENISLGYNINPKELRK